MKKAFIVLTTFIACITFWSCNQGSTETKTTTDSMTKEMPKKAMVETPALPSGNVFIPIDSANMMLSSYLNSINYQASDSDIKSIVFNADSLRSYLNDTSRGKIAWVRVMVAHNIKYITTGGRNRYAGCKWNALTAIIVGMDVNNNFVYNVNGMVMDHAMPCPASCATTGTGASDLLPSTGTGH